ncbi:hypothetical protein ACOMHN_011418 [Nucella lapillus]
MPDQLKANVGTVIVQQTTSNLFEINAVLLKPQFRGYNGYTYGAVEMVVKSPRRYQWYTMCDTNWDDSHAKTVCRLAGYVDGRALCCGQLTQGVMFTQYHTASNISCPANATSVSDCSFTTLRRGRCPSRSGIASAVCYSQEKHLIGTGFSIRLTNGSSNWGRVEVKHLGVWGAVCSSNDTVATVACRQIHGLAGGVVLAAPSGSQYEGSLWASQVNCSGQESSLEQCVLPPWGSPPPASCQPMWSLCYQSSAPTVELVGSSDGSYGRVEIVMDGSRYTVCDDHWTTADASVVCRSKGYAGGVAIKSSHYGQGSGGVALSNVRCRGGEASLLQCRSNGWLRSTARCDTHHKDASVFCHGPVTKESVRCVAVVLQNGDHNNGIVQVMSEGFYDTICGTNFDDAEADVVCRQLGYERGRTLPSGSYGPFLSRPFTPTLDCQGNETSVYNCTLSTQVCASTDLTNYAAVHCFNGTLPTARSASLVGGLGDLANSSGHVRLQQAGVQGRVCSAFWGDEDARVVCRQLGFSQGLAYGLTTSSVGPFLLTEVDCAGTEGSLWDCPTGNASCTTTSPAGAFCFDDAPQIQLVGGSSEKEGQVEITYGGVSGTVTTCNRAYRSQIASVICRSLGYSWGIWKNFGLASGRVMLSDVHCKGTESSVFGCSHQGFMAPPEEQCDLNPAAMGVSCSGEVRLRQVFHRTNTSIAGVVGMYKNQRLIYVCKNFFGEREARVVCGQLGYSHQRVMPVGPYFTVVTSWLLMARPSCAGNETSLASCPMTFGRCATNTAIVYLASVHCSKDPIVQGLVALPPSSQPGEVLVQVDGVQSRVCTEHWDDQAATLYCHDLGYSYGTAFSRDYFTFYYYELVSGISCNSNTSSFGGCNVSRTVHCGRWVAHAFCYNSPSDFQVRLVGGSIRSEGIVEVGLNGQWGSVCSTEWTRVQANVVCRSLGFVGGDNVTLGTFGTEAAPAWILSPRCTGRETSITGCDIASFNNSATAQSWGCDSRPVAVRCTGEVKLEPNKTYGAVHMAVNASTSTFSLVCADGFGLQEARVTCRDLGYPYGLHMSPSAFGDFASPPIRRTNMKCTGYEPVLKDCSYSDSLNYCPSMKYASVVCSRSSVRSGYQVSVESPPNSPYGRVKVQHMGYWGYVCPDSFTDQDATVFCKEADYAGGLAFNYRTEEGGRSLHWLKNISCTGQESFLTRCPNVAWGNITGCDHTMDAAVFCYQHSAPQFRLVNGTSSKGRLELRTDRGQGSVCGRSWTDQEAGAACRSMGFHGGRYLGHGAYGQGSGDVLVVESRCSGTESSLFDCSLRLKGQQGQDTACLSHQYDAAVQCFDRIAISGSSEIRYGGVEVFTSQQWVAVCDQGFDTNAALVVCGALGYSHGRPQCCSALGKLTSSSNAMTATTIGLTVTSCRGDESTLLDCQVNLTRTCSSAKYASVLCSDEPILDRLLEVRPNWFGRIYSYAARIEVNRYGIWGPVCYRNWDDRDTNATCHGLGFNFGRSMYRAIANRQYKPIVVGNVNCTGLESSLSDCTFGGLEEDLHCFTARGTLLVAEALCYNISTDTSLRLADGGKHYGRLEVQLQGQWGAVMVFHSPIASRIACNQMGFMGGSPIYSHAQEPEISSNVTRKWMDLFWCHGHEKSLFECMWNTNYSDSFFNNVLKVKCYNDVRLSGGNGVSVGRVQMVANNTWGVVCDDQWTDTNTRVTCQNLGFDDGFHLCCGIYGDGWPPVADRVACKDTDTALTACPYQRVGHHQCLGDTVAVSCYNGSRPTEFSYSIEPPSQVVLTYNGLRGHICSDGWDDVDARHDYVTMPFWATNISCQGTERRLRDCQFDVGRVTECRSSKWAGVLCTNSEGIFYRLGGSATESRGRVEVSINGEWGAFCGGGFGQDEAAVFCRSEGYREGSLYTPPSGSYSNPPSTFFNTRQIMCSGQEESLDDCRHRGWRKYNTCLSISIVRVRCYNDVRIGGAFDHRLTQGPVQFYHNGTWYNPCDTGFDDVTARRVCQDQGFVDGAAVCCSGYGSSIYHTYAFSTHVNYSMQCHGEERSSMQCVRPVNCTSRTYASVVCFGRNDAIDEGYTFDFEDSSKTSGMVAVTHMNIKGRVCNNDWDDNDARVLCKTKGHLDGLASLHFQYNFATIESRGPFWVSNFNCTGNETSLNQCPFKDRLHLGNCSKAYMAGAICFNDSGIQYRISSDVPQANEGRVEIAVGGVWGTVCRHLWDDRDAKVFCRGQGYTDGYSIPNRHDVYVSCVDKLKLNLGYGEGMGAVMVHRDNTWNLICDSGLDHAGAMVVCRQLGFPFGTFVKGGVFGKVDAKITVSKVQCRGTESNFSKCTFDVTSGCQSGKYASVVCSKDAIAEKTDNVRIQRDNPRDAYHGYLEYQKDGVWGAVCASTIDTNSASVACKQLGFNGGVLYTPSQKVQKLLRYQQPILTSNVKCKGTESRLDKCARVTVPSTAWCDFYAPRAGVLCYNDTDGVSYRLTGEDSLSRGRVEMKYSGQYGVFCTFYGNNPAARVACKAQGFTDGLAVPGAKYLPSRSQSAWLSQVTCKGNDSSLLECGSQGFKALRFPSYAWYMCFYRNGPLSVQCYQDKVAITKVRLVNGDSDKSGRVEVFLAGPNQWGTVCDNNWNDVSATVVCNQLGFATGKAVMRAGFGEGKGEVWLNNVGCRGNEARIQDCGFDNFNAHTCLHKQDAGAICFGVYVPNKTVDHKKQTSNGKTAAIVTPIVLIVLAAAIVLGILLYRRRQRSSDLPLQRFDNSEASQCSDSLVIGQGGMVRFFNRVRGLGRGEGLDDSGLSNPCYTPGNSQSPDYGNATGVSAADHVDF